MVSAPLDQHVTGVQFGFAVLHHRPDLPTHDDGKIRCPGFVHARSFRVIVMGVTAAHLTEGRAHIGILPDFVGIGREGEQP